MLKSKEKESSKQLVKSNVGLEEQKLGHTWSKACYLLFPMHATLLHVTVSASNIYLMAMQVKQVVKDIAHCIYESSVLVWVKAWEPHAYYAHLQIKQSWF